MADVQGQSMPVEGRSADGDAHPGRSVPVGGRVDTSAPVAEADGDIVPFFVDPEGRLFVSSRNDNLISTNNSTVATLGVSGNFTGPGDDVLGYGSVTVMLFADQDSAVDGMIFEFSSDDSNWDDAFIFTFTANDTRRFQFPTTARYFRINYTNGGTGQGAFRVQTILHRTDIITTIHRVVDDVDPDRSATLVKAIVAAQAAGSGDFVAVQATAAGNFKTALEEIDAAVLGQDTMSASLPVTIASDQSNLNVDAVGNVAHDAVDSGDPIKLGHKAVSHGATPTSVAADDRTDWYANRAGIPFVIGGHPNIERLSFLYTGAQSDTVIKTVNANERFVVTAISALCNNANSVDVSALFEFDDATDVPFSGHPGIPAGGGYVEGNGGGILTIGGVAFDVLFTCSVPTGGSIQINVSGYLISEA